MFMHKYTSYKTEWAKRRIQELGHKCLDCNVTLKSLRAKRCRSCGSKFRSIKYKPPNQQGVKRSIETKRRISKAKYKNGISLYRKLVKEAGFIECEHCNSKDKLNVHHKNMNRKDNRLENLQVLCASCHNKLHWKLRKGGGAV